MEQQEQNSRFDVRFETPTQYKKFAEYIHTDYYVVGDIQLKLTEEGRVNFVVKMYNPETKEETIFSKTPYAVSAREVPPSPLHRLGNKKKN